MSLISIINGPVAVTYADYTASSPTFNSLGTTTNDGIKERETIEGSGITSGLSGETLVEGVTAGSNMTIEFVLQEVNTLIVRKLLRPYIRHTTTGLTANNGVSGGTNANEGAVAPAGLLWSQIAGQLKLTPMVGSAAAGMNGGNSVIIYRSVLITNGAAVEKVMSYRERFIPIQLTVLPYLSSVLSDNIYRFWEYSAT